MNLELVTTKSIAASCVDCRARITSVQHVVANFGKMKTHHHISCFQNLYGTNLKAIMAAMEEPNEKLVARANKPRAEWEIYRKGDIVAVRGHTAQRIENLFSKKLPALDVDMQIQGKLLGDKYQVDIIQASVLRNQWYRKNIIKLKCHFLGTTVVSRQKQMPPGWTGPAPIETYLEKNYLVERLLK